MAIPSAEYNSAFHTIKLGDPSLPPVILLHGWGKSSNDLLPLGEILQYNFSVHIIDLPGFGKSTAPIEANTPTSQIWGTKQYADSIVEYMKKESIESASFIGHSFGGRVTIQIASNYPEKVNKIVLIGTPGLKRKRSLKETIRFKTIGYAGKFLKKIDQIFETDLFKRNFVGKFGSPDYLNAGIMRPIFVKTVNEDYSELVPTIKAKTLLLWGKEDREVPIEVARRMQSLIKDSNLIEMEGRGHEPYVGVGVQLCGQYVLDFLRG